MQDLYRGRDPRDIPTYTLPDAAHLTGVAATTLLYWIKTRPVVRRPDPASPLLTFTTVIELYVLATLRRKHGISLRRIRPAIDYVREHLRKDHPLAEQPFETDGSDLFIRHLDLIINASRQGQIVIPELIEVYLQRVEWDQSGRPYRYFPLVQQRNGSDLQEIADAPRIVMVDPRISFGKPALFGSGIPTAVIAGRFRAGDSIRELALDLDRDITEIEEAIRYESRVA
jgi:uncharacterized protein (DUF433 family)